MLNKDYKEMLQCLLEENVRFLLVPRHSKFDRFAVSAGPVNITVQEDEFRVSDRVRTAATPGPGVATASRYTAQKTANPYSDM
jgi:hypothetical protein